MCDINVFGDFEGDPIFRKKDYKGKWIKSRTNNMNVPLGYINGSAFKGASKNEGENND